MAGCTFFKFLMVKLQQKWQCILMSMLGNYFQLMGFSRGFMEILKPKMVTSSPTFQIYMGTVDWHCTSKWFMSPVWIPLLLSYLQWRCPSPRHLDQMEWCCDSNCKFTILGPPGSIMPRVDFVHRDRLIKLPHLVSNNMSKLYPGPDFAMTRPSWT